MTTKQLVGKIREDEELQESLDNLIRDHFSMMASAINNRGPEAQLEWLKNNGMKVETILKDLMETA